MAKYPNDDLFESTKMSFGEHLEELRVSLFRAVVGLVIGFAIGLLISKHVMNWMQYPLKQALENYYIEKAIDDLKTQYQDDVTPELQAFVRDNRLVFDEMYLEAAEVQRIGRKISLTEGPPKPSESAETLTPTKDAAEKPPIGQQSVPEQSAPEPPVGESKKADKSEAGPSGERPSSEGQADSSVSPAQEAAPAEKPTTVAETSQDVPTVDQKVESPGDAKKLAVAQTQEPPIPLGVSRTPGGLSIHRDVIPPPQSFLVNFRTWRPVKMEVRSLNAQEAFMIWMKAGFITGVVVASPWIFWQVWMFVAAGLYPHEKNYVYMYLPFSMLLFVAGGSMAFFFVFEPVLDFLFSFNKVLNIDPDPRISEWLGFVLILPLGFGISFQLPLVMLFVNRLGLVSLETYIEKWRVAILAIFVVSAVLTPADPISIFLMAVPLTLLYFLGLGLCKWMPRIQNPYAETAE